MKDSKSVPIGSPVGQNERSVPIGSHVQPSDPIGDKNWITIMALKRAIRMLHLDNALKHAPNTSFQ
jgi:hypothetical protein